MLCGTWVSLEKTKEKRSSIEILSSFLEEVCRVMENLANDIYTRYFPSLVGSLDNSQQEHMYSASNQMSRHANHDPKQRKGKMSAAHDRNLCEACRRGLCFPSNV